MSTSENNHVSLVFDIGELSHLVSSPSDIANFLQQTVQKVAAHLGADVCSIYLFDDQSETLVLRATQGLNPDSVNRVGLKPGEGLVGTAFEKSEIVCEGNAQRHPLFKYIAETNEDSYNSLLALPIRRGVERIGVLVVQKTQKDCFRPVDIHAVGAVAVQLAGVLEQVRLLMSLSRNRAALTNTGQSRAKKIDTSPVFLKGIPASDGNAFAPATIIRKHRNLLVLAGLHDGREHTLSDLSAALERTLDQLRTLQAGFEERLPESASLIFTAHFMMLKDNAFGGAMLTMVRDGASPVDAIKTVAGQYMDIFTASPHAYMREKALDVEDLALRILSNLNPAEDDSLPTQKRIVISAELYPSDILKLAAGEVAGFVLVGGGVASHVAILCRSLRLPLVISDDPTLLGLPEKTPVLLDADLGNIYLNPDVETLRLFDSQKDARKSASAKADWMTDTTYTRDGERVTLLANINLLSEVSLARQLKAEGVGLYRTEFPFLIRTTFPSEEEQRLIYQNLFDGMHDRTVTIRTLDAGGDKALAYTDAPQEENPELGLRSIRFSLQHRDVFENQIRAILRAAEGNPSARLMFPLISSVDELLEAKAVVRKCMADLEKEGSPFNPDIQIGMMIELPSVLGTIDAFAAETDFFSIGTNDFVQYMLAADRTNKMVSGYYLPHHPAVLRGLDQIATAARVAGIEVSVCGEMAHDVRYIPFLVGIGIRSLSVNPKFLPDVQAFLNNLSIETARDHARRLLTTTTVKTASREIESYHEKLAVL